MLRWRLLSAAIILAALLGLFWLDYSWNFGHPGIFLAPLLIGIAALATGEMLGLFSAGGYRPSAPATYAGTLLVVTAACAPVLWTQYPVGCPLGKLGWPLGALAIGVPIAFLGEMRRYRKAGGTVVNIALAVFTIAYVGLSLSFFAALRLYKDNATGLAAMLSLAIIVKAADTGAYAVGRAIGRHKLTPILSPGKTIEGAVGGIVTACLVSWLCFAYLFPWLFPVGDAASVGANSLSTTPWWGTLVYGILLAIAGLVGDLAESLLKRDVGRKDSSTWLPGLGGVLDILDSLLFAAPVACLAWAGGLVG